MAKLADRPKEGDAPSTEERRPRPFTPRGESKNMKRITLCVGNDGKIDFDAMGSEGSKAANVLLSDPKVQLQFGIGPLAKGFDPEHCKHMYNGFGALLQFVAKNFLRWPEAAVEHLAYTDKQTELLKEPTAKALDEVAPVWFREHQAIGTFLVVFGSVTQANIQEAAMEARRIAKQQFDEQTRARQATEPTEARAPLKPLTMRNSAAAN